MHHEKHYSNVIFESAKTVMKLTTTQANTNRNKSCEVS